MTKKLVRKEGIFSAYPSTVAVQNQRKSGQEFKQGNFTWSQVLMQRPWRNVAFLFASHGLLRLLSSRNLGHLNRDSAFHNDLALHH